MPVFTLYCMPQVTLLVSFKVKSFSRVQLFATPWTVAHQAPPSMGFSRQEYWSGLSFPSPEDLPDPGLPHCRQTLYRLSHQGSPVVCLINISCVPCLMQGKYLPVKHVYFTK